MSDRLQFNLRGMLALTFFVACTLGLTRWLDKACGYKGYGFLVTLPLAAIPFALLVEWMIDRRPKIDENPPREQFAKRITLVISLSALMSFLTLRPVRLDANFDATTVLAFAVDSLQVPQTFRYLTRVVIFLAFNWYVGRASDPQPAPARIPTLLIFVTVLNGIWFLHHWIPQIQLTIASSHSILGILMLGGFWIAWLFLRRRARPWALLAWGVLFQGWLLVMAFPVVLDQ